MNVPLPIMLLFETLLSRSFTPDFFMRIKLVISAGLEVTPMSVVPLIVQFLARLTDVEGRCAVEWFADLIPEFEENRELNELFSQGFSLDLKPYPL